MLLLFGVILYLFFLGLAIAAAFMAAFYSNKAYTTMPANNSEKKDLLIVSVMNWIIFGILTGVFVIFIIVLLIVILNRAQPAPLLYIGLTALLGGFNLLLAWYMLYLIVSLATSLSPSLRTTKKYIGYSTTVNLAAGLFSILGVICLIALSRNVDGHRYKHADNDSDIFGENETDEAGNTHGSYGHYFNKY